jgi:hypothetical protein
MSNDSKKALSSFLFFFHGKTPHGKLFSLKFFHYEVKTQTQDILVCQQSNKSFLNLQHLVQYIKPAHLKKKLYLKQLSQTWFSDVIIAQINF